MHYADDAIITTKQNKCFKEVIKDLTAFELASGSKFNYEKTKGLWCGTWKNCPDTPLNIKWTSKNVENLGVYFGNDMYSAEGNLQLFRQRFCQTPSICRVDEGGQLQVNIR